MFNKINLKKIFCLTLCVSTFSFIPQASASSPLKHFKVDRVAHAGISYVIADQLHRNTNMNKFWASVTAVSIGALKEATDGNWSGKDFASDCIGVLFWNTTGKF